MIMTGDEPHRYVIHDRDSMYSEHVDRTLADMGLTVLRTPVRAPQANAFCERLVGTIRRECVDVFMPVTERHLREIEGFAHVRFIKRGPDAETNAHSGSGWPTLSQARR